MSFQRFFRLYACLILSAGVAPAELRLPIRGFANGPDDDLSLLRTQ